MDTRPNTLLMALAMAAVLLLAAACSHMTTATPTPQQTVELEAQAMAAQGGNGFVCDGGDSTFSCFCKKGATDAFSCNGMDRLCRVAGQRVTCKADGWCHCGGLYPKVR